ncbi:hypothetical protein AX17_004684 [Amanita inopinata Kibby_2008]|nr:hypothetical protein AX17_004684 [Amanita inopinata Kibby_2008]
MNLLSSAYRFLYRGALSLPDSHLTLDGITFCARIDTPSKNRHAPRTPGGSSVANDASLLENPLALALESMRGRPTLRFVGTVKLSDVWIDESGGVFMDIHPNAILTKTYFENVFCLGMCARKVVHKALNQESDIGVKVALGDSDDPETTYVVVYARLDPHTPTTSSSHSPNTPSSSNHGLRRTVQLIVARLAARPPDPISRPRLPRPDDPIPRKPPLFLFGSKVISTAKSRELRRADSTSSVAPLRKDGSAKDLKRTASIGGGSQPKKPRLNAIGHDEVGGAFKIPDIPSKPSNMKGKGKSKQVVEMDVFGVKVINGEASYDHDWAGDGGEEAELERANKNAIKKATLDFLAKTKDPGRPGAVFVNRSHPEFKEIFQWVYRGVSYALRARMKSAVIEPTTVQRLVKTHAGMYVGGEGGTVVH